MSAEPLEQALDATAAALGREKKVLVTTHVKPDGDALGCVIAAHEALTQMGADSIMYLAGTDPIAPDYRFLTALEDAVRGAAPPDHAQRTLLAVDCGNDERIGDDRLVKAAPRIINIDHHVDNTRFGEINLVVPAASSTAEILYFVLQRLNVEITPRIGEALYTGILVDSGRFQYSSTSPATFRVAADLISHGVDHTAIFRQVYENMPLAKARLLCLMLSTMQIRCDGLLAVAVLDEEAFREAGAGNGLTEGLVDTLRAIEGVQVAALIYARTGEEAGDGRPHYRVSLRSSNPKLDVQKIAKEKGGGGHTQAAGFSADESPAKLIEFVAGRVAGRFKKGPAG